jgi:hypothetical protein
MRTFVTIFIRSLGHALVAAGEGTPPPEPPRDDLEHTRARLDLVTKAALEHLRHGNPASRTALGEAIDGDRLTIRRLECMARLEQLAAIVAAAAERDPYVVTLNATEAAVAKGVLDALAEP